MRKRVRGTKAKGATNRPPVLFVTAFFFAARYKATTAVRAFNAACVLGWVSAQRKAHTATTLAPATAHTVTTTTATAVRLHYVV